jgi:hypothetical protein
VSLIRWEKGTTHFKSAITPGKVERHNRKADREKAMEAAYELVNKRDGGRSRVTGTHLTPGAPDPKARREHHHIVSRSRSKALREKPSNIMLCSAFEHDLIERGWLVVEGKNADRELFFHWSEIATSKPLQIRRWNPRSERADAD